MAQRKSVRHLDLPSLIPVLASLIAFAAIGALVHGIMWARVRADDAQRAPVDRPTDAPAKIKRHHLPSGSIVA